jgi:hypothetical protein
MANPSYPGRMINQGVSQSEALARLSSDAGFLYFMIIPHLNSHGKMCGEPSAIKGLVCPLIRRFTPRKIEKLLQEISRNTNLKWWEDQKGLFWVHATRFHEEQTLRKDRLGKDHLPSWPEITTKSEVPEKSGSGPGVVPHEVELEGEVKRNRSSSLPSGETPTLEALKPEDGQSSDVLDNGSQEGITTPDAQPQSAAPESEPKTEANSQSKKPRPPDPIWDTICDLFGLNPVDEDEKKRIGRICSKLRKKEATPEKTRLVYQKMQSIGWDPFSPEGVLKWYDQLSQVKPSVQTMAAPIFVQGFR